MEVKWKEYKGKKILCADFEGLSTTEDLLGVFHKVKREFDKTSDKILYMANMANTPTDLTFMDEAKRLVKESMGAKSKKTALIVSKPSQKVLAKTFKLFTKVDLEAFYKEEEALEFLAA